MIQCFTSLQCIPLNPNCLLFVMSCYVLKLIFNRIRIQEKEAANGMSSTLTIPNAQIEDVILIFNAQRIVSFIHFFFIVSFFLI